jgi:hypothetical protein
VSSYRLIRTVGLPPKMKNPAKNLPLKDIDGSSKMCAMLNL